MIDLIHFWRSIRWHAFFHSLLIIGQAASGVELPVGITPNTETLVLSRQLSQRITGQGTGKWLPQPLAWSRGNTSYLVRTGSATTPIIEVQGRHARISDLSIVGKDPASNDAGAGIGVLLKTTPGTGTGSLTMERVSLGYLDTAWQISEPPATAMSDTSKLVGPCDVYSCNYVVRQTNQNSMLNRVEGVEAMSIRKAFFRCEAGGNVAIRDSALTKVEEGDSCAILEICWGPGIGSNNCTFLIENFKCDNQCGNRAQMLRMETPKYMSLTVIASHIAGKGYGNGKHIWELQDGCRVLIIGGDGLLQKHSFFVKDHPKFPPPLVIVMGHGQCADPATLCDVGSGPIDFHIRDSFALTDVAGVQEHLNSFYGIVDGVVAE